MSFANNFPLLFCSLIGYLHYFNTMQIICFSVTTSILAPWRDSCVTFLPYSHSRLCYSRWKKDLIQSAWRANSLISITLPTFPHINVTSQNIIYPKQWMKISTLQFEVAVRVRLNIESLTLILKPHPVVFLGQIIHIGLR